MPLPKRASVKAAIVEMLQQHGQLPAPTVHKLIAERFGLSEADKAVKLTSQLQYKVEIRWAKQELVGEGIVAGPDVSGRGQWQLSGTINSPDVYPDEALPEGSYKEGASKRVSVNRYERNEKARLECLKHHGYNCKACGFNFEKAFGILGKQQIHVHHTVPISTLGTEYQLDPIKHLVPLCPNCHHMAHRREPPFNVTELQGMLNAAANEPEQ
ncbi:MAG TPA: HNH endonuclease [Rhodoferax sp.]|uniref:winged helix-turn-helix domain-containing protein n=1 Tax=Rhodoferax sp. TaxID=50421 RepID=UPI000EDCDD14|nr:winged helix-turn-helix domain-containing protein [Rhodoferax sp.]HCX81401.1 HNH endonuclease [Rhodoferax sp.]